jgi:hypothetical protein
MSRFACVALVVKVDGIPARFKPTCSGAAAIGILDE